jgi:hypothetical protein
MKATSASLVVIRTRLRRLGKGIDAHVGRRPYGAQHRSDAAVWKYLRKRVDAELRQRDAAWQGYTAGLSEAQIQAKIATDPAFVGAEQVANEAVHDLLRGRGEPRESNKAATPVVDREREPTAERGYKSGHASARGGTARERSSGQDEKVTAPQKIRTPTKP